MPELRKSKEHRLKSVPLEVDLQRRYYERDLPHWQPEGRNLFLTWRLSGSLPVAVVTKLRASKTVDMGKRFREYDVALDSASTGPRWLRDERVADVVAAGIKRVAEDGLCRVHAWVVMPNHVHVLMEPRASLGAITKRLKGTTARAANSILGRTGKYFWQDESFDHWVRDEAQLRRSKDILRGIRLWLDWLLEVRTGNGPVRVSVKEVKRAQTEVCAT